jgi:hypothetical protein
VKAIKPMSTKEYIEQSPRILFVRGEGATLKLSNRKGPGQWVSKRLGTPIVINLGHVALLMDGTRIPTKNAAEQRPPTPCNAAFVPIRLEDYSMECRIQIKTIGR